MALVLRYKGGSKKKGLVVEEEEVEVFIEDSAILTSGPNRRWPYRSEKNSLKQAFLWW